MDMRVFKREAGVPLAHTTANVPVYLLHVDDCVAETSWADHGAVRTRQASGRDIVPPGIFGFFIEQLR